VREFTGRQPLADQLMPFHFKALIIVMFLTPIMFALAKPLFTKFMSESDFAVRRNLWIALTLAAFLIPEFWPYTAVAALLIAYAGRKDSNPAALYLFLLLAVPPIRVFLTGFGLVRYIIAVDHLRVLSLMLLLPAIPRLFAAQAADREQGVRHRFIVADTLLVMFVIWQTLLLIPFQSATANMRHVVELSIDVLLPYFVVSRLCRTREAMIDAMAAFVLSLIVLVPLAFSEFVRGWILYAGLEERWGTDPMISYLTRGDYLRAQVTAGHSIVLGYAMAIALGFWLFLQSGVASRGWRWLALLTLLVGLIVTLARGPWLGALLVVLSFYALGPNGLSRTIKAIAALLLVGGIVLGSPYADKVIAFLPFVGNLNEETIGYRQRLAEVAWLLVQQNPVLGTPYFSNYMEELRQGQGIIDIVNTYAVIALGYGLVGLGLFVSVFGVLAFKGIKAARRLLNVDPVFSMMGASLVACLLGTFLIIATVSNYLSIPYLYFALAGLTAAYLRLAESVVPSSQSPDASSSLPAAYAWSRADARDSGLASQ